GSIIVGVSPNYTVSSTTPLTLTLELQDEQGATVETKITPQAGSNTIGSPNLTNLSGLIETIAGTGAQGFSGDGGPATSALINAPVGIVVDSFNNIYFSDSNNCTIRQISSSGIIIIVA